MTRYQGLVRAGVFFLAGVMSSEFLVSHETLAEEPATKPASTRPQRAPTRTDIMETGTREDVEAAAIGVLADNERTVDALIVIVDPANAARFPIETRTIAAYLLGEMGAKKAVPVLCKALGEQFPDMLIKGGQIRISSAVWAALVHIGRPAVPELIKIIEQSDDRTRVSNARIAIWNILGGKQHLLELLAKLEARATDEKVKARIRKQIEEAKENREDDPPLF